MSRAREAIAALRVKFAAISDSPALDAAILVAEALGLARPALDADPDRVLSPAQEARVESLAERRAAGEPVAYLTGRREFWSLDLEVTPDVLVPRPETELLVEWCLEAIAGRRHPAVLDLGTGSGAIALAIALERPDAQVTAVDASAAALAVAARNAARHRLANLRFLAGDWFTPVGEAEFAAIVSNPPYVAPDDPALATLAHEPRAALVAGDGGLADLAAICTGAPPRLAHAGCLIVEHGARQGAAVRERMARSGLADVTTRRDLAGRERATRGNRPR